MEFETQYIVVQYVNVSYLIELLSGIYRFRIVLHKIKLDQSLYVWTVLWVSFVGYVFTFFWHLTCVRFHCRPPSD